MGKFDGILICTDLDGTLYKNDKSISSENKSAIEYFKKEGGIFTFVTGRMPFFAHDVYENVKPNAPVGCVNGAGLYDYEKNEYIWTAEISDGIFDLLRCVDENFPNIGIQVNTYHKVYFCKDNSVMTEFRKITNLPDIKCDYAKVKEPVAKIVFGVETDAEIKQLEKTLKSHPLAGDFDFIRSEEYLFEILPGGIGKGTSVEKLCEHLGIDINKTIAVGDYNNDISMFRASKVGVAVANGIGAVKAVADYVTESNDDDGVANFIEQHILQNL